jgi:hypothetical protein
MEGRKTPPYVGRLVRTEGRKTPPIRIKLRMVEIKKRAGTTSFCHNILYYINYHFRFSRWVML